MGSAAPDRSIYAYDPRIPPKREVEARIKALVEERRGTYGQMRFGEHYILTCWCGALDITPDMNAPERFRADHSMCLPQDAPDA